jgi:5,10-methylenetetrahydromethanopterin reductase
MATYATLAEECGYEMVWSAEDYFTGRDAITPLACFALSTKRLKLGTGVINPYTRSPGLIAATMATLDELSNGRMVLGLGAGLDWTSMYSVSANVRHVKTMRETLQLVRALFSDKTVTHRGRTLTIQGEPFWWPGKVIRPVRSRIPIYIGARGPKMEQLAAEAGDGLILDVEMPVPFVRKRLDEFRGRVERAGRDFNAVDVACLIPVSVSEDGELDEATRRYMAWTIAGDGTKEEEERKVIAEYSGVDQDEILRVKQAFKRGGLKEACMRVSEKSVSTYVAWGSVDRCVNKIKDYVAAGVKLPTIVPLGNADAAIRIGQKFAADDT